ncbi:class I SAM-dependent methyltransferase [Desmospora activa]|uniref:Methyltransferase family protein n=1 Tax=Desmospora activa DSM 45169 TaxID=1121389 RepID=A0A2T4ZDD4_9BACL|nr:class I SAM-dependent methyltransferase [Desmospora activa]PTM59904.1 methyltransferase family protein [Desmospora activa DSM 45169]
MLTLDRHRWAAEILAPAPSDHLLEIGCGHGAVVSLICKNLCNGTITAIERSETMIYMAKKLNVPYQEAGKVRFLTASFHEADLGQSRFNKIFAVNVNLFWMKAARELEIIQERLLPGGAVYLFNQPPIASKISHIAEHTRKNLLNAGFAVRPIVIGEQKPVPVVCVIGERKDEGRG